MNAYRILLMSFAALLVGCAHSPPDEPLDPIEPVNRVVYSFNNTVDKYALRPAAKGYVKVVPSPGRPPGPHKNM